MEKPYDDPNKIRDLYIGEGLTLQEIASELGCGISTIHRRMDKFDIETRSRGSAPNNGPWDDPDTLSTLYFDEQLTQEEIGDRLGTSKTTIRLRMESFGIEARTKGDYFLNEPWRDEKELRRLYIDEDLTQEEIGNKLGCSDVTVSNHLRKFGLKEHERDFDERPWDNELLLRELYTENRLTQKEIADTFNCSRRLIGKQIDKFDIVRVNPWDDTNLLRILYVEDELSCRDIGETVGCSSTSVYKTLKDMNVQMRPRGGGRSGSDHHSWTGGKESYRGPNWYDQRRKTLERDDYRCQHTGITNEAHKEKYGCALHVHHITPFRYFGLEKYKEANRLYNLVTLSYSVHGTHDKWADILYGLNN